MKNDLVRVPELEEAGDLPDVYEVFIPRQRYFDLTTRERIALDRFIREFMKANSYNCIEKVSDYTRCGQVWRFIRAERVAA